MLTCLLCAGFSGHANYCAANAAADAIAGEESAKGLTHAAIQWGAWSSIGEITRPGNIASGFGNSKILVSPAHQRIQKILSLVELKKMSKLRY